MISFIALSLLIAVDTVPPPATPAAPSACETIGSSGQHIAGCGFAETDGADFGRGFINSNASKACWEAIARGKLEHGAAAFTAGIASAYGKKPEAEECNYESHFLAGLCGVAISCSQGGQTGMSLYPIAGLGLATFRIGGGVQAVFNGLGSTSIRIGAGFKVWQFSTILQEHAFVFYAPSNSSSTTTGQDLYRFGIGAGAGLFNGIFTTDLMWIFLGDSTNAQFKGGGLALSFNIDVASGALLGLAALSPSK